MQRQFHSNRDFRKAITIEELRALARRRLPAFALEYLEGGAEDEVTLRRNRKAFERVAFVPRTLTDVSQRDLSVEVFGRKLSLPLAIAPTVLNILDIAQPAWMSGPSLLKPSLRSHDASPP